MPEYTEEQRAEALAVLRVYAAKLGRTPTTSEWNAMTVPHPSCGLMRAMFGSWRRAVEAAGLTPRGRGTLGHTARTFVNDEDTAAAVARYDQGETIRAIADDVGLLEDTLCARMVTYRKRHGLPPGRSLSGQEREAAQMADPSRDPVTAPPLAPKQGRVRSGRSRGR